MKKKTNRLLSILLCCVMLIGLLPTTAFAWTAPTLSGNGGGTWNIQLSDEGVLSWNNQQSATSYTIEVDKTAMGSTLTKIENINGTSYNLINRFKELKIENGTYYFQIKANGPDTTSNTISFKYVSPQDKLSAPLNLRWDGTTAKWDSVANATGYTVILYTSSGSVQLNKTTTETQYDWTTEAADGRWFEVVATADNYRDSNPAEGPRYGNYSWTAPTLTGGKAEWNVTLSDDGMLRWNDMSSATYDIEVDKTAMGGTVTNIYSINTNTYNLINRFKTLKLENGTYYFTIKANDSDTNSGTISFKYISPQEKLSVPQNLRWDGTVAKWDSVANATGYTVILYTSSGSVQLNKTTTETQYNWDTEAADGRWFEVIATAADYRDSNAAESPKYVVVSYSIGAYPYDATVDATQAGGQVYLTTDEGTDGWSSDGYIKTATEGSTVTLNANPATGYKFVEWRQGTSGATISTEANYQFTASENKYLYAVFETVSSTTYDIELDIFDITYTATDGGTVSIQANQGSSVSGSGVIGRANENTAVTITAVPKQGYEFVAWKKWTPHNATAFSTDATYTFTATEEIVDVNENPELFLYAVFQETQPQATTYVINCVSHNLSSNETGGTVMLETDKGGTGYAASQQQYATENTTVRLRAVAEPGYQFVAWRKGSPTDANATVSTDANYQFTATEAVWMYAVFEYTPDCTVECVPFDITGGINNGQGNVGGTVSIQTDKGTASGTITQSLKATRNSSVTVNAVAASGYEFLGWKKASPYVQDFVSTTASYTFNINEELYLYAVFQETSATNNVVITAGTGMSTTGNANQTVGQGSPIISVVYTAADGYYFPDNYSVAAQNGINVTRNSYTQITVSGTPTAAVNLTLTNATAKTKETTPSATFTAESENGGKLTGVDNTMKYSVDGGSNWLDITGDNMAITNVTTANGVQVKKPASDANTKLDSDPKIISVTKATAPTTATGVACTTNSNNDGKLQNVTNLMEYKKSDAPSWTDCGGTEVSGLVNGTYYVRVKATGTILASDYQEVQIAAYGAAQLTGTVTITGDAKYGEQLTATVTGSNNSGDLSYQWVRNTSNISGATGEDYTLVADDIGKSIKVVVTSSVQSGNITSNATATVEKADGPVAPTGLTGVAPTTAGGSDGKITGTSDTMEYSIDSSFTNPTGTVCQDTETTGFTSGTYYVRVKETTTHKAGAYATVTVPAYSISLDTTGTQTFTAATVGYGAQTAKTITVSNTGTGATGALTVALSGSNASSFTLSKTNIANIAVGGNDTFTVVPKTGLSAGTYTATVTVSGGNSINASFNVSFTVNPAGGGGGGGGYTPATYSVTVDKTDNGSVSASPKSASKGTTVTITVKPDTGYELDTLKVVDKNGDKVAVSEKNGKYTFTMPASKVTVTGTFVEIEQPMVNPFIDVKESDYFYNAVMWAVKSGVTKGTSATTFSPNAPCTRAQMVTFLWRASGSPKPVTDVCPFTDVNMDSYYGKAVLWAVETGITNGTSETTFSPEADCTRAQMAAFLCRMAGGKAASSTISFTDVSADAYYAESVQWAVENGITLGTGDGTTFSPNEICTRAQMVTFLYRFFVK